MSLSRLSRLFAPLPTLAAVVVIAVTCLLGNWQLGRGHEKLARAAQWRAYAAQPALDLNATATTGMTGRTVRLEGHFDATRTILLDNRPGADGRAGFLVLTPLKLATGGAALVLRGWLPRDAQDRTRIAPFSTPAGDITLTGTALAGVPQVYHLGSASEAGQRIRQNADLRALAAEFGTPLLPLVVEQHSDTGDGLLRDWPAPDLGVERHFGYAFQWFGLAALTLVLWLALGWRRARRLADGAPSAA